MRPKDEFDVYLDIDGVFGRFNETDRDMMAMLASQVAVAAGLPVQRATTHQRPPRMRPAMRRAMRISKRVPRSSVASEADLFPVVRRAIDRFENAVYLHLICWRLVWRLTLNHGEKVRNFGAVALQKRAFARRGARRRNVDRATVQFLRDPERR